MVDHASTLVVTRRNGLVNNLALLGSAAMVVLLCGGGGVSALGYGTALYAAFGAALLFGCALLLFAVGLKAKDLWGGKPVFAFSPEGFVGDKPTGVVAWADILSISAATDVTTRVWNGSGGITGAQRYEHKLLVARRPGEEEGQGPVDGFEYPRLTQPDFTVIQQYVQAVAPHVVVRDDRRYGAAERFLRDKGLS